VDLINFSKQLVLWFGRSFQLHRTRFGYHPRKSSLYITVGLPVV